MSYTATVAGVRAAIAAYAQAVDDGRYGDIAALLCEDGSVDLPAVGVVLGPEALAASFRGEGHPPGSRHVVTSTYVTRWSADHAVAISDLVVVGRGDGGAGPSGQSAGTSTGCTAGAADGDFPRGPCGSPMTPRRPAAPAAAGNHGKAP